MILDNLRELQEASDRDWILNTTQVCELLGVSKKVVVDGLCRHGFTLKKADNQGQQSGWRIEKHK